MGVVILGINTLVAWLYLALLLNFIILTLLCTDSTYNVTVTIEHVHNIIKYHCSYEYQGKKVSLIWSSYHRGSSYST